jgi:hypothetical protein
MIVMANTHKDIMQKIGSSNFYIHDQEAYALIFKLKYHIQFLILKIV